jgi:RNA polymerase-binding transcription factor DksA
MEREEAVARKVRELQRPKGPSPAKCEDCGDDISPARQIAAPGCRVCVPCGEALDLRTKGVRRV